MIDPALLKAPLIGAALVAFAFGGALQFGGHQPAPASAAPAADQARAAAPPAPEPAKAPAPQSAEPAKSPAPPPAEPAKAAASAPVVEAARTPPVQEVRFGDEAIDDLPPEAPLPLAPKDKDGKAAPPPPAPLGDPTRIVSVVAARHLVRANAESDAARLANRSVKTVIVDALDERGDDWVLLTLGPIASRRDASDARLRLRDLAGVEGDYVSWKKP